LDTATTVPPAITPVLWEMWRRAFENPHRLAEQGTDSAFRWKVPEGGASPYATEEEQQIIRDAVGADHIGHIDAEGYMPERLLHIDDSIHLSSFGDL
ncbi:hypothetical protein, partial [Streptomyces calidiresistens]|uniref:hypothetical protein n=1 Tax=Streptomyces calidiresistens TaxID=1485586 RepID=UPI0015FBB60B